MKKVIVFIGILFTAWTVSSSEIKMLPLDFTIDNLGLSEGQIAYGWKLMSWEDWLARPTSGPLFIVTNSNKSNLEVFEAHAAAMVEKPSSFFTKEYLHNINTIRKLDPKNQHTQIPGPQFSVETIVPFPSKWSKAISIAKLTKLLDDKTTDYIKMDSVFIFASKKFIDSSPDLQRRINLLDITKLSSEAINRQGTTSVNQIADFISIVTVFYKIDDQKTLVVSTIAVAIKKHVLNLGINAAGATLNGRSILLGENSAFNTDSGIGSGLPKYFLELFEDMISGFESETLAKQ